MTTTRKPRAPRRKPATPQTPPTLRLYAEPRWRGPDAGEGGIRQVMEHVAPYLEARGVVFVDTPAEADVIQYHAAPYSETQRYIEEHPEVPVVSSCHGMYWADYEWDGASLSANADVAEGLRLADVVTAPTEWVAQAIRRGISADVRVVPHGVDSAEFEPAEHEGYILWDKTRVDPVCDPTDVIALAMRMPEQRFVMCAAPEGSLPPNVVALGRLPYEKAREITRHAALYLCVTRETFGLATLQAMAAGVPVVGYRFGGQAEIIDEPGDGGILVNPGDVDSLVDAVREALVDRAKLSECARSTSEIFTWDSAADGYMAAYRAAIEAHASPVRCTVIVAAYNAEKTIARTILSAKGNIGAEDEMIIVDDASTDGTVAAAESVMDSHCKLIRRAENGYLAQARNEALRIARGRYVTCLDADDELPPDALNVLAGELDRDRSTAIAYGKVYFIDDTEQADGTITSAPSDFGHGPGRSPWPFAFDWTIQAQAQNVTCIPYAGMVRTAWLRRAGGWRTRCRTGEDLDLWMRLVSYGARPRMVTDADTLIYHTSTHSMSVTNRLGDWGKWYPWTEAAGQVTYPPFGVAAPPPRPTYAWPVGHNAEPLVSVVIPVGPGHERYVLDAVDSVAAQTYRRFECIVVNDTDDAMPVLPSWCRVVTMYGRNIAHARNAGLGAAVAPYVVFLDADDWLDRDALAQLVPAIEANPDLAVVYPDYWERTSVTEKGRVEWRYTPHMLPDWDCARAEVAPGSLYGITAIYRRTALEAVGGFDTAAPGHEDADLQMALTYGGHCAARLPRRLYVYNLETGQRRAESKAHEDEVVDWLRKKYDGRPKVSCSSCGGGGPRQVDAVPPVEQLMIAGQMTEVEYLGARAGSFTVRGGTTRLTYEFARGDTRPVMNEDLAFFESAPEYRVIHGAEPQAADAQPQLKVDGPPSGRRAAVA